MLGMDIEDVRREVARRPGAGNLATRPDPATRRSSAEWPNPDDPSLRLERDTLKLMLQYPLTFDAAWNGVEETDFSHPGYAAIFRLVAAHPLDDGWVDRLRAAAPNDLVRQLLVSLLVEPLLREPDEQYSLVHSSRLQLARVVREIQDCKSRLQRTDPVKDASGHRTQFAELTRLEMRRKSLLMVGLD